ncbi:MAG: hypothetical protein IPI93_08200 [Sphingobacteriaceae bacterium]|nr:hypothetical protein [Sphingobacteriaceae bacterium]
MSQLDIFIIYFLSVRVIFACLLQKLYRELGVPAKLTTNTLEVRSPSGFRHSLFFISPSKKEHSQEIKKELKQWLNPSRGIPVKRE